MALSKIQSNSYEDTAVHGQRNLIINGACVIDQRNGGSAITSSGYVVDRFHYQNDSDATLSLQQSSTVPDNFTKSISVTVSTADASVGAAQYSMMTQRIEGYNIANLGWGTSAAKAVTLSFYVRSSVTGTFGGVLNNSDSSRSYPFTYSISSADTWEKKTITIEGDTSGTWNTTNSSGIQLRWAFGMGSTYAGTAGSWSGNSYFGASGAVDLISTVNATWYITGVQLELGDTATTFEHRSFGDELAKCQRYYRHFQSDDSSFMPFFGGMCIAGTIAGYVIPMIPKMRSVPTLETSGTASHYEVLHGGTSVTCSAVPAIDGQSELDVLDLRATVSSGLTVGDGCYLRASNTTNAYLALDAEL